MTTTSPPQATSLKLTLDMATDTGELKKSLSNLVKDQKMTNKIIQELHIDIQAYFNAGKLMLGKGKALMKAFGSLPHLKTVVIRGHYRCPFPVSALTTLFAEAPRAEFVRFCLYQMMVVGSPADFEKFSRAVARHTALQVFDVDMLHFLENPHPRAAHGAEDTNNNNVNATPPPPSNAPLDPLLKVLMKIPTLTVLLLGGCEISSSPEDAVTVSVIEELLGSKTIEKLSFFNFCFSLNHIRAITKGLTSNTTLKNICISCCSMRVIPGSPDQEGREVGRAFASALRANQTLHKLVLYIADLDQDEDLNVDIFQAVRESKTLKGVYLGSLENITPRSKKALIEMLQSNYVLESFGFVCANRGVTSRSVFSAHDTDIFKKMALYVRLNKAGRGRLLQDDDATPEQWISSLISVKDDLGCLYYLLSHKPSLLVNRATFTQESRRKRGNADVEASAGSSNSTRATHAVAKRKRLYRAVKYTGISYR